MIAIAGNTPGTVRRTYDLPGLVVLLVAAVAGGIDLFNDLAELVPAQLRRLPQRIHHALQPVVFVVPEAGGAAVGFDNGRGKRAVLQPGGGAGIAVGIGFLHPVAHLVVDEGDGVAERIDTARQKLVIVPLVAPVFTALVHVADDKILCVPVVAARLTVVVLDGRQPGG